MLGFFNYLITAILKTIFTTYRMVFSPIFSLAFNVHCRYEESCSQYTERMILERGLLKGIFLGIRRIGSCNKFNWRSNG